MTVSIEGGSVNPSVAGDLAAVDVQDLAGNERRRF